MIVNLMKGIQKAGLLIFIVVFFFLLYSCNTEKKEGQNDQHTTAGLSSHSYRCLEGISGSDTLILHLVSEPTEEGGIQINGFLHLKADSAPFQVFSEPGTCHDSIMQLEVTSIRNGQSGRISLTLQDENLWDGSWTGIPAKPSKIRFHEINPEGGVKFHSLFVDSSFRYKADSPKPAARFAYHFLLSEKEPWLKDSILREIHKDSLCRSGAWDVQSVFNGARSRFLSQFREDAAILSSDSNLSESLNYCQLYSPEVFYNQQNILSFGLAEYQYMGGAHGMLFTRCMNFDLIARKRIRLQDLFKPGFENRLKAALNSAAKAKYRVNDLSEILLVKEIEPGDNFYLSKNGICFSYLPYEIAPFVMGEPLIYIPFSQLKEVLKK